MQIPNISTFIILQIPFIIAVLPILGYDDNSIAPVRLDATGLYWHSMFLQHYTEHSAATLSCIVCHATVLFICCLSVLYCAVQFLSWLLRPLSEVMLCSGLALRAACFCFVFIFPP